MQGPRIVQIAENCRVTDKSENKMTVEDQQSKQIIQELQDQKSTTDKGLLFSNRSRNKLTEALSVCVDSKSTAQMPSENVSFSD